MLVAISKYVLPLLVNLHASSDSSQISCTSALEPLFTCRPASSLGAPLASLFNSKILSANEVTVELTIVCVPLIVTLPLNTASSLNVLAPPMLCAPLVLTTVASTSTVPAL